MRIVRVSRAGTRKELINQETLPSIGVAAALNNNRTGVEARGFWEPNGKFGYLVTLSFTEIEKLYKYMQECKSAL